MIAPASRVDGRRRDDLQRLVQQLEFTLALLRAELATAGEPEESAAPGGGGVTSRIREDDAAGLHGRVVSDEDFKSAGECARLFAVSDDTIRRQVRKHGILTRPHGEHHRRYHVRSLRQIFRSALALNFFLLCGICGKCGIAAAAFGL